MFKRVYCKIINKLREMWPSFKIALRKFLKVVFWSVLASLISWIIVELQNVQFPAEYAILVPAINGLLFAIKSFIDEHNQVMRAKRNQ